MEPSDAELMRRWQGGDTASFEEIVRRWQGRVGRLFARLAGPSAAPDLCQEVFLRLYRASPRYREEGAFAMPAVACTIIFTYALRGAGDTRVPVLITWVGFLGVRIPLTYWLRQPLVDLGPLGTWHGGLFGAWLAMFADLYVRGALILWRFASGHWKRVRV